MQHRLYPLVACAALSLAACSVQAEPLRPDNTVGDVLAHPAFAGFAERLLPWDDGRNDPTVKLSQTARLMPYHQNIRTDEVLGGLNRLISDAEAGKTVFYDIYSESERRADPSKRHTGLFVFHGRADAPSVVISAGGGFSYVGSLHEAFPIAKAVSEQGYNAFVVKYRAGKGAEAATRDVAKAIEFINQNQKRLQTDMRGYSLWGASASARIAAYIGSYGTKRFGTGSDSKPAAVIMLYTGHSDYNRSGEVPVFAIVGGKDGISPPQAMQARIDRLKAMGVPAALRICPTLGHGFALGTGSEAAGWHLEALRFWQTQRQAQRK